MLIGLPAPWRYRMQRNKGFSLLEILVAFSILAVALGIVLRIFSTGVDSALLAQDYNIAVQQAEALLARVGVDIPLQPTERNGLVGYYNDDGDIVTDEAHGKYRWRLSIMPKANHPQPVDADEVEQADSEPVLMVVQVVVEWGDDQRTRQVVLDTLKVGRLFYESR